MGDSLPSLPILSFQAKGGQPLLPSLPKEDSSINETKEVPIDESV